MALAENNYLKSTRPIGLNLKADTPEEIALSIMSEIVAVRRGGKAGFMKNG